MLVTENIDYDFASNRRHGIFREIPVRLDYDSRYERIYPLEVISVEGSEGTPDEYEKENTPTTPGSRSVTPTRRSRVSTATPSCTGSTLR